MVLDTELVFKLNKKTYQISRENCQGCIHNSCSQRHHDCLYFSAKEFREFSFQALEAIQKEIELDSETLEALIVYIATQ